MFILRPHSRLCYLCYKLIEVEFVTVKAKTPSMGLILSHYMDVGSEQRTRPQTMKNVKIDVVLYLSLLQFLHLTVSLYLTRRAGDKIWDQLRGHSSSLMIVRGAAW